MIYPDHLQKAKEYSRIKSSRFFYFTHFYWAIHLSALLLLWSFFMLVHAFIPQFFGFYVVEGIVNYIKELKNKHPDDPILNKITFTE